MSNPLPVPPSNDTPGGLIKSTDVSTLYNLLAGNTTNSISIDGAITASDVINAGNGVNVTAGAITAGGGLSVPSGQTATVAGTLGVTGTLTIPNATAPDQPPALGQFLGPMENGTKFGSLAASTTYTQSVSFTAPSAGYVWGQARLIMSNTSSSSITLNAIINGTTVGIDTTILPMTEAGVTSVSAGASVTVTAQAVTGSTSPGTGASLYVDAIFIPALSN